MTSPFYNPDLDKLRSSLERADLIRNVDLKSIGGNGIEKLELIVKNTHSSNHLAIKALLEMRSIESVPVLAKMVATNFDFNIRYRATKAISEIRYPKAVSALVEIAATNFDEDIRKVAVYALGKMSSEIVPVLAKIAESDVTESIRRTAIKTLRQIETPGARGGFDEVVS